MLRARALGAALMAAVAIWGVAREAAGQPVTPKKYALLIGMNTYSNGFITGKVPELKWAVDDAKALAAALTDLGYDTTVIPKTEATRRRIIEALNYFATKATENDSFILYYAGHGVRNKIINEQTYWLTWDSELEALDPSGLRLSHLFDYVKDIKAKRKLILLDHCFAGDLVRDLSSPSPAAAPSAAGPAPAPPPAATDGSRGGSDTAVSIIRDRNVEPLTRTFDNQVGIGDEGTVIIAAARDKAFEVDSLKHGIFTYVLLRALTSRDADSDGDGKLNVKELKDFLWTTVKTESNRLVRSEQEVEDLNLRGTTLRWTVADRLPVSSLAQAEQKVRDIQATLTRWAQWMTIETRTVCWQSSSNWLSSIRTQSVLSDTDKAVMDIIDRALANRVGAEKTRAEMLDREITPFVPRP